MKHVIVFIITLASLSAQAQHPEELLEMQNIEYIKHISNQSIKENKNATALITTCVPDTKGLFQTLKNNPQIEQLFVTNVDQDILNVLFQLTDTEITTLEIYAFQSETCLIPTCQIASLEEFQLYSEVTTTLEFTPNAFRNLQILHVEMNQLSEWKGVLDIPTLGLFDASCRSLKKLPVITTPKLDQYMLICSAPIPMDICDMPNILYFYFSTTQGGELAPCHEEILKRKGLIEFEIFSEDPEKTKVFESQESIDFNKEMEEQNNRMQEELREQD